MEYGEYARQKAEFYTKQVEWFRERLEAQNAAIKEAGETIREKRAEYGPDSEKVKKEEKIRRDLYRRRRWCQKYIKRDAAMAEKFRKEAEAWESRK